MASFCVQCSVTKKASCCDQTKELFSNWYIEYTLCSSSWLSNDKADILIFTYYVPYSLYYYAKVLLTFGEIKEFYILECLNGLNIMRLHYSSKFA